LTIASATKPLVIEPLSAGDPADEREASAAVTARGPRVLAMDIGPGPGETREAAVAKAQGAGVTLRHRSSELSRSEPWGINVLEVWFQHCHGEG
jgi:hypothetical protein